MPLLVRGFEEMDDTELRTVAVALAARYEDTGVELYKALADKALDVQARRMAAGPNPYEEASDVERA